MEKRDKFVFYASSNFMIYKEGTRIVMADCDQNELSSVRCPLDFHNFRILNLGDAIILCLAGKDIYIFDKAGATPIEYRIDLHPSSPPSY